MKKEMVTFALLLLWTPQISVKLHWCLATVDRYLEGSNLFVSLVPLTQMQHKRSWSLRLDLTMARWDPWMGLQVLKQRCSSSWQCQRFAHCLIAGDDRRLAERRWTDGCDELEAGLIIFVFFFKFR